MKELIEAFPDNIKEAISIAESTNLKRPKKDIKNILMCGLGGSDRQEDNRHKRVYFGHERVHQQNHAARNKRSHRTDRQINSAGGDNERSADCDNANERAARKNVTHIARTQKRIVNENSEDE